MNFTVISRAFSNAQRDHWDAQEIEDELFVASDEDIEAMHGFLFNRVLEEGPKSPAAMSLRSVGAEIDRRLAANAAALYRDESSQIAWSC